MLKYVPVDRETSEWRFIGEFKYLKIIFSDVRGWRRCFLFVWEYRLPAKMADYVSDFLLATNGFKRIIWMEYHLYHDQLPRKPIVLHM